MFFILSQAWDKEKILTPYEELTYMTHCNFLILFTEHDAIDIADPSNMQDTYLL